MSYGPADLYAVEFPKSVDPAQVTATLRDVTTAGIITLLDVAMVRTSPDGSREVVEFKAFADEIGLAGVRPAAEGLIGDEDLLDLSEEIAPDSTLLVVLLENAWARKVAQSVQDSHAVARSVERFSADVVNEVAALAYFD
ncbi:MAG: DUF6325 family protein [Propionicimonas sp.]